MAPAPIIPADLSFGDVGVGGLLKAPVGRLKAAIKTSIAQSNAAFANTARTEHDNFVQGVLGKAGGGTLQNMAAGLPPPAVPGGGPPPPPPSAAQIAAAQRILNHLARVQRQMEPFTADREAEVTIQLNKSFPDQSKALEMSAARDAVEQSKNVHTKAYERLKNARLRYVETLWADPNFTADLVTTGFATAPEFAALQDKHKQFWTQAIDQRVQATNTAYQTDANRFDEKAEEKANINAITSHLVQKYNVKVPTTTPRVASGAGLSTRAEQEKRQQAQKDALLEHTEFKPHFYKPSIVNNEGKLTYRTGAIDEAYALEIVKIWKALNYPAKDTMPLILKSQNKDGKAEPWEVARFKILAKAALTNGLKIAPSGWEWKPTTDDLKDIKSHKDAYKAAALDAKEGELKTAESSTRVLNEMEILRSAIIRQTLDVQNQTAAFQALLNASPHPPTLAQEAQIQTAFQALVKAHDQLTLQITQHRAKLRHWRRKTDYVDVPDGDKEDYVSAQERNAQVQINAVTAQETELATLRTMVNARATAVVPPPPGPPVPAYFAGMLAGEVADLDLVTAAKRLNANHENTLATNNRTTWEAAKAAAPRLHP